MSWVTEKLLMHFDISFRGENPPDILHTTLRYYVFFFLSVLQSMLNVMDYRKVANAFGISVARCCHGNK